MGSRLGVTGCWARVVTVNATGSPLFSDDGHLMGVVCISCDSRTYKQLSGNQLVADESSSMSSSSTKKNSSALSKSTSNSKSQVAIVSRFSHLVSKMTTKVRLRKSTSDKTMDRERRYEDRNYSKHHRNLSDCRENAESNKLRPPGLDAVSSAIAAWSRGIENEWTEEKPNLILPWLNTDEESELNERISETSTKAEHKMIESNHSGYQGSCSSLDLNSTSSKNSSGSTSSSSTTKVHIESDYSDYDIPWEDLTLGENIGQGASGTVYHGLWFGLDVAVKVFPKQDYSDEAMHFFRQEVSLMKRLRHPNVLLFMGAVTSADNLCIVTVLLPRGSLFQLIQKSATKLEWRRRICMAMDIARGMNYLHHCNPPIVHRDLKSSNLLVDKNWTVKVGDFGLSRIKHETFLSTKTGKGTPQWMAPEVIRNELTNEKSDVYSFGVILWELVTEKIPWGNLNSMQVIGAVGFMNQRLEIPQGLHPELVSIIESCWDSDPKRRPAFHELLGRLKNLLKHHDQLPKPHSTSGDASQSLASNQIS